MCVCVSVYVCVWGSRAGVATSKLVEPFRDRHCSMRYPCAAMWIDRGYHCIQMTWLVLLDDRLEPKSGAIWRTPARPI